MPDDRRARKEDETSCLTWEILDFHIVKMRRFFLVHVFHSSILWYLQSLCVCLRNQIYHNVWVFSLSEYITKISSVLQCAIAWRRENIPQILPRLIVSYIGKSIPIRFRGRLLVHPWFYNNQEEARVLCANINSAHSEIEINTSEWNTSITASAKWTAIAAAVN